MTIDEAKTELTECILYAPSRKPERIAQSVNAIVEAIVRDAIRGTLLVLGVGLSDAAKEMEKQR